VQANSNYNRKRVAVINNYIVDSTAHYINLQLQNCKSS